jgi:hypothetical protein
MGGRRSGLFRGWVVWEALKRVQGIFDLFFVEGEMDFGVEVWWEVV